MDFKGLRRYVNHNLLRNDILHRLGAPETFFSAADDETRDISLAASLKSAAGKNVSNDKLKQLRKAVSTWRGERDNEPVEALVMDLYVRARALNHVRPTKEFPKEEQVRLWLNDVGDYMSRTESFAALQPLEQEECALKASRALRMLSDFLAALDVHSPHFWRLFTLEN